VCRRGEGINNSDNALNTLTYSDIALLVANMLSNSMLRLREHRERLDLTLRRLGKISGVHYVAVARLEAGRLDPRLSTLMKLCKALGVTLNDLVKQPKPKGAK
jgi:predicted transcriptional regulator